MAKAKADLIALKKKFALDKEAFWDCHGTIVMMHRGCESVAQQMGIVFDEPKVLLAESDSIAILVTGHVGDESSWSVGEASPKNNKNAYPWAMAEKRAKDRVILKLARFSEVGVYSDIEADDFKKAEPMNEHTVKIITNRIDGCDSYEELCRLWATLSQDIKDQVKEDFLAKAEVFPEYEKKD